MKKLFILFFVFGFIPCAGAMLPVSSGPVSVSASECNLTPSPDSSAVAFTRGGDLWMRMLGDGREVRITSDASDVVSSGYASWVYYEEILGRASGYKAFWWSPDSKRLAFYRFDNTGVSLFPIYSPFGQNGSLNQTRYPKAGQKNPSVKIGLVSIDEPGSIVWADFQENEDQYFGTPFWDDDSRSLYVQWMPRRQNILELYKLDVTDGSKKSVYTETYPTWTDWIDGMLFSGDGLYMARSTRTGWEQIYYLPFDGSGARMLTEGRNWDIDLLARNPETSDIWFSAKRDSRIHSSVYKLSGKGKVTALTDPELYAEDVKFSSDFKSFTCRLSNARTPYRIVRGDALKRDCKLISDTAPDFKMEDEPQPQTVKIINDGYELYGLISYPKGFDSSKKYPVVMQVYGGPGTPYVRDRWHNRDASDRWCWENGFIYMVVDPRSSGENGREGMDQAFRRMTVIELQDYIAWAKWLQSKPFVAKIGVEGFSFGGTTTAMLVMRYPEYFHCGIAGGGVYDWRLYDTHYTERYMETPQSNPEGYREASPIYFVEKARKILPLKLTHGTGDDNVHLQNTLLMMDALQKAGVQFELMLYPDGMHGYRGAQKTHSDESDHIFWQKHLLH